MSMRALCRYVRGRERLHSWMTRSTELKLKRSESGKQPELLSKSKSGHMLGCYLTNCIDSPQDVLMCFWVSKLLRGSRVS